MFTRKLHKCLICFESINKQSNLYHLIYHCPICLSCLKQFDIIEKTKKIGKYEILVLYAYNDFFRSLLYQYKAQGDYVLKSVFLSIFPELKTIYQNYVIVVVPSSKQDNDKRGFNPNYEIIKSLSNNIFTEIYKLTDYKQTKQKDRSLVKHHLGIRDIELLANKNILIFDDVITSGSTIKTCISLIEQVKVKKIKILVLASNQINNIN